MSQPLRQVSDSPTQRKPFPAAAWDFLPLALIQSVHFAPGQSLKRSVFKWRESHTQQQSWKKAQNQLSKPQETERMEAHRKLSFR